MRFDIEHLPTTLYLADQVRELDRIAIHEYGIAGFELMSKAARFAFHAMIRYWPKTENIVVLCGAGNILKHITNEKNDKGGRQTVIKITVPNILNS